MAASSNSNQSKYDVFVSYRGEDVRKSFMDHLFKDFEQKGIHAFRDYENLPRGQEISSQLYKAIEESRILIVIFSKGYASSSWCLRELVSILNCKKMENPKHEVRIIFYDVKPDVVRQQKGIYAKAFAKHEVLNNTEEDEWKKALSMAADLSGWDIQDLTNGYEAKFIDSITKEILLITRHAPLHVDENIVGIDVRVNKLNLLQFVGSSKVHMIGICGVSGTGKTTLVKAIYNSMYVHFDGSCFCEDIQRVSKRQGLTHFQNQLIADIMKTKDAEISNVTQGIAVIKKMISSKPILIVLDDVDHREQLEALAGSPNWFYPGSLIFFTSKDKQLLRSHRVDYIYDMEYLNDVESLKLFASYAFKDSHISSGFEEFVINVVKYVRGHPLALKVFGCFLYEKTVCEWASELDSLKLHPNDEIQRVLRRSYDGLNVHQQKILLDIACSLVGLNRDFVVSVLDSCNYFADTDIRVLVDKSLITISSDMSLQMHDLIQAMAKGILSEESTMHGKQKSRLWISSEIYDVLSGSEVIVQEAVELIDFMLEKTSLEIHVNAKAFERMKKLRILKIYHREDFGHDFALKDFKVKISGSLEFLSNELRLLYWCGFPFKFLPTSFYPKNIVAIDLSYSNIKHLWTTPKCFIRLKVMRLRHCRKLRSTPDFTQITNLEELILEGCVKLTKLHPSVGMLKRLIVLNMKNCKRLMNFPCKLETKSLKVLCLSGCLKLDKLPESLGSGLTTLEELHINRTSIKELPSFVYSLTNLDSLSFGQYERIPSTRWSSFSRLIRLPIRQQLPQSHLVLPSSLSGLNLLKKLDMRFCDLSEVPDSIVGLSHLKHLNLAGNTFTKLPDSLSQLPLLEYLGLDYCKNLEMIPQLPPSTRCFFVNDCTSLCGLPEWLNLGHVFFSCIFMGYPESWMNLTVHDFKNPIFSLLRYMSFQFQECDIFPAQEGHVFPDYLKVIYHGNSVPRWFTNRSKGNRVKVDLPSDMWFDSKVIGYAFCVVVKPKKYFSSVVSYYGSLAYFVNNFDGALLYSSSDERHIRPGDEFVGECGSDMIWLEYTVYIYVWKFIKAEKFVTFTFVENENVEVKECGVRLVYDEDRQKGFELSMIQDIPTPTQDGGVFFLLEKRPSSFIHLTW
ncbi:disease resistance protein Roq1-like [Rutidosis leptorrhynchoides]|uniref:disease resistance protein Roq1-like n=1 Tax=Rutidosis leptorrhynchoides TaxID=125765 RepID=UPI003A9A19FF